MKIVVKVGTSTLTYENGQLNLEMMEKLSRQISNLQNRGDKVILVTSGAIGAGMGKLNIKQKPKTLPEKQSLAAVGQGLLIELYEKFFNEYGKVTAQLLLTKDDFSIRDRYLNISYTISNLLNYGVVPIINENDTVTVDEIKIGDNDTLSALVASLIEADILIILTDIDGLYNKNPSINNDAILIDIVEEFSDKLFDIAGGAGTKFGTGGMYTKMQAAKICYNSGVKMIIANGKLDNVLNRIANGEKIGTTFIPMQNPISSRKVWIAFNASVLGKLVIDDGAKNAILNKGKSLLPGGIKYTDGEYSVGDCVSIVDTNDKEIARGLINYTSSEVDKIKGYKSGDIEKILGYKNYDEVIHRDNLVIIS
ncbi:glutamate 5-kinase [Thermoanaerobacterium sp. RBIITD]|uniref:glutamate 5-kinase n=1 Tax=Thermoanaerobacterium sp. RBIITD TaxID=1550240 RepID=UPI000BB8E8A7|nr:glutamate 5-kinase [Thermoanaerobacterium sp. RBIITD]SNX55352.1 glutamate 5-kinase [Thermoanaerobacterium sp. RBIITD]